MNIMTEDTKVISISTAGYQDSPVLFHLTKVKKI